MGIVARDFTFNESCVVKEDPDEFPNGVSETREWEGQ